MIEPRDHYYVMDVLHGAEFKGARARWYQRLIEFDGKTLAAFKWSCMQDPPSIPKSGRPESVAGWIWFFQGKKDMRRRLLRLRRVV